MKGVDVLKLDPNLFNLL